MTIFHIGEEGSDSMEWVKKRKSNAGAILLAVLCALGHMNAAFAASGRTQLTIVMREYTVVNMASAYHGGDFHSGHVSTGGQNVRQHPSMKRSLMDISGDERLISGTTASGAVSVFRSIEPAGVNCPLHVAGAPLSGFDIYLRSPGEAQAGGSGLGGRDCSQRKVIRINVFII